MKKKGILITSLALALLLVVGGVMAWFTAEEAIVNSFKAGTLEIDVDEDFEANDAGNVNPGDKIKKEITIENAGTKRAYLRMKLDPKWYTIDDEEQEIVKLADWGPASIEDLHADWELKADGYYYYKHAVAAGGTAPKPFTKIAFATTMDNDYQGVNFDLTVTVEAIQVTNGAVEAEWPASGLESIP